MTIRNSFNQLARAQAKTMRAFYKGQMATSPYYRKIPEPDPDQPQDEHEEPPKNLPKRPWY